MKATTFKSILIHLLEDMTSGSGGALGDFDATSGWSDSKDARLPKILGKGNIITRPGLEPKKRKKKKKKKILKSSYRANTRVDTRVISPKLTVR